MTSRSSSIDTIEEEREIENGKEKEIVEARFFRTPRVHDHTIHNLTFTRSPVPMALIPCNKIKKPLHTSYKRHKANPQKKYKHKRHSRDNQEHSNIKNIFFIDEQMHTKCIGYKGLKVPYLYTKDGEELPI